MLKFLLVDNGSRHIAAITRLLPTIPEVVSFAGLNSIDPSTYDGIILSGSSKLPVLCNETLFETELSLIRDTTAPLIGICLGAELIACAFDGTLRDLGEKRTGLIDIVSTDEQALLLEKGRQFSVYEAHRWTIDTLPNEFHILATSSHGPEIIKHHSRPLWGLQFHPEHLTESTVGDKIFLRILTHSLTKK